MDIPSGKIDKIILRLRIIDDEYFIIYSIYYLDGRIVNLSDDECGDCIWNHNIKEDIEDRNIGEGEYDIKDIKDFDLIDFDKIGNPEKVEIDSSTSITLNVQKMILETLVVFFNIDSGDYGDYGFGVNDINEINSAPDGEKMNLFLNKKGIPNVDQPGLTNMIDKFIRSIIKSILFFAKQYIAMIESAKSIIEFLKDPTKLTIFKDAFERITKMLEDIKKMFTDTVNWMKETFLGPLGEVNIPVPSFVYNLGEIVPAFPFPIPIPEIPTIPSNMIGFKSEFESMSDFVKRVTASYENQDNLAKINVLKNIPYLQNFDPSILVMSFQGSESDKELGAVDLKRVGVLKGITTIPLKILIGIINSLVSSVIGLLSFDFSKIQELIKTMLPTLDSIKLLVAKLLDSFIPNVSKVVEQNGDVKPPLNQEELMAQKDKIKNLNIDNLSYGGPSKEIFESDINNYEKNISNIIKNRNDLSDNPTENPLRDYIDNIRDISKNMSELEKNINDNMSEIFIPNTFQMKEVIPLVNQIVSNVNSLDKKIDDDGNKINETIYEDEIVKYFDNISFSLDNIYKYANNEKVLEFISYYEDHGNLTDLDYLDGYIRDTENFIKLNLPTIDKYFDKYDNISIDGIEDIDKTIRYIKKLKYIKYNIENNFLKKLLNYKELLKDFKNNLIGTGNEKYTRDGFNFNELEYKYLSIKRFYESNLYDIFSTYYSVNKILIDSVIGGIPTVLNNFENIPYPSDNMVVGNVIEGIIYLKYRNGKYYFGGEFIDGLEIDGRKIKATKDISINIDYNFMTAYIDDSDDPHAESELNLKLVNNIGEENIINEDYSLDDSISRTKITGNGKYTLKENDYIEITGGGFKTQNETNGEIIISIQQGNNDFFNEYYIDRLISDIDSLSNFSINFDELLLIESDLSFLVLSDEQLELTNMNLNNNPFVRTNRGYDEDIVLRYFLSIRYLISSLKELIEKDKSMNVFDNNGNRVENSIREKFKDFLINIVEKTKELDENDDNLYDILDHINDSIELEKKIATTKPDQDKLSDFIMPLNGILKAIPQLFLSIFKGIFDYLLDLLPDFISNLVPELT